MLIPNWLEAVLKIRLKRENEAVGFSILSLDSLEKGKRSG